VKAGGSGATEMTLSQFQNFINILPKYVDETSLDIDLESEELSAPAKAPKVMRVPADDKREQGVPVWSDDGDDDDDDDIEELDEEEAARQIFDELKGSSDRSSLPLEEFLQWEDVQELLESGALSKDNLAMAIQNAGITVEQGDLTFEMVSCCLCRAGSTSRHSFPVTFSCS
jgi:hypothetical protein